MTLFESDPYGSQFPEHKPSRWKTRATIFGVGLTLVSAVGLLLTFVPSNPISDISAYSMSTEMAGLTTLMGLTEEGLDIFSDARPELLASGEFLDTCSSTSHGSADDGVSTVGCFISGGYGGGQIAIFDTTDERLVDQTVVTAAHELLHAAYLRLGDRERAELDPLLDARWSQVPLTDPLQLSLSSSVGGEDGSRSTEQFAYLGTTVEEPFDPELEAYYSRYFQDRSTVTAASAADRMMWDALNADYRAAADAVLIQEQANATESAQIQGGRAQLSVDQASLNEQVTQFTARSAADRANLYVSNPDGSLGAPYGQYLASFQPEYTARDADLTARQAQLDAAIAAAQLARADVDRRYLDIEALSAAAVPSDR